MKLVAKISILLTSFGATLAVAGASPTQGKSELIEVPFKLENRLPTVTATIAGKPLSLFVDLGGYRGIALVARKEGDIELNYGDQIEQWRNSEGKVFTSRLFSVSSVKVGPADFGSLEGIELPVEDRTFAQDGFLGFPALSRFLVVLDYPNQRMRFYPSGSKEDLKRECGSVFPLQVVAGVVQSTIETDRGPLIFQWDTGSTENVLRPSSLPESSYGKDVTSFPLTKFVVGGHDFGRIRIPLREFVAPNVDGILGTDFFESKVVCLDLQNQLGGIR